MNRFFRLFSLCVLVSTVGQAQLSKLCTQTYIPNEATAIVNLLKTANAQPNASDRQESVKDARTSFRNWLNSGTTIAACFSASTVANSLAGDLEARRFDVQTGASAGASGSTNLVSSGSVPALLGLAVEYGGLTEAFSGTTTTFRTTPAKLIEAMTKRYGPGTTPTDDRTLAALEKVSLSVSFDTSRTASANGKAGMAFLANYQQLSQATARIILHNDRDPLSARNWRLIRDFSLQSSSQDLAERSRDLLSHLGDHDPQLNAAMAKYDVLVSPDLASLEAIATAYLGDLQKLTVSIPGWSERLNGYIAARLEVGTGQRQLYSSISRSPTLSLELSLNRPPVISASSGSLGIAPITTALPPPDLFSAKLIYTASLLSADYTLNAQTNFFTETRTGTRGNFRDFQVSGKLDVPIGNVPAFVAKGTLTFSGLYEHLHQKPLGILLSINDQNVNQPGNIGVFQAKYSIPIGDSGVQIPISFTASNRTELIKEKEMRGNVGITFDLDKLFTKK